MKLSEYKRWLAEITDQDTLLGLIDEALPVERYPFLMPRGLLILV